MKDSKGINVFDAESVGFDCDAYFSKAFYEDGSLVPDCELDFLTNSYSEVLEEHSLNRKIMSAEAYFEEER